MFSKKTFATALCAAFLPLATMAPALAAADAPAPPAAHGPARGGFGHAHFGHRGMGGLSFLRGVTLTDAQRGQIRDLMHSDMRTSRPLLQELRADRGKMGDMLASTAAVDQADLTRMQQHDAQLMQQIGTQRIATILKVRALLTPDQLKQSEDAHKQLAALHQQRDKILHKGRGDKPAAQ